MKNTKKSLVLSIVTLLLCTCMFVGSTFAWFTDTVSNTGNRIQAGTLKVDLLMDKGDGYKSIAGGQGDIFKEAVTANNSLKTLWEPGKTQFVKLAVENKGNLALKYNIIIDVKDEGLVGSLEYAIVNFGHNKPTALNAANWDAVKAIAIVGDVTAGRSTAAENGKLDGGQGERDYFILAVHMKENAGNEYQGKDVLVDVCVVATQATAELDGFNSDQYDKDAKHDVIPEPVHETGGADISGADGSADIEFVFPEDSPIEDATIDGEAASKILEDAKKDTNPGDEVDVNLSMKIDTKDKTSDSITFDITLEKTVKINGEVDKEKSGTVTELGSNFARATVKVGRGLGNVRVNRTHNGTKEAMNKLTSKDQEADGYFYDGAEGDLTISSNKYSDFEFKYGICDHSAITEWTCDAKHHTAVCPECGTTVKVEHVFTDGVCVCGYKSDDKLLTENPNYTCRIGNTGYERMFSENVTGKKDSALSSAKSGDTIIAIADYTTTNSELAIVMDKDFELTIDLNGKVITLPKSCELDCGVYNFYDSSNAKTGTIVNGIDLYNNQDRLKTITVNIYGGNYKKVALDGDHGDKTLNIYDGNINLVEVQGSEKAGPEGTPQHRNAVDKVFVNGGNITYVSHSTSLNKDTIFTFNNGCCIGNEVEYSIKLAEYGSEFMANARKMYSVIVNE